VVSGDVQGRNREGGNGANLVKIQLVLQQRSHTQIPRFLYRRQPRVQILHVAVLDEPAGDERRVGQPLGAGAWLGAVILEQEVGDLPPRSLERGPALDAVRDAADAETGFEFADKRRGDVVATDREAAEERDWGCLVAAGHCGFVSWGLFCVVL
jgi:hypothetical protein